MLYHVGKCDPSLPLNTVFVSISSSFVLFLGRAHDYGRAHDKDASWHANDSDSGDNVAVVYTHVSPGNVQHRNFNIDSSQNTLKYWKIHTKNISNMTRKYTSFTTIEVQGLTLPTLGNIFI